MNKIPWLPRKTLLTVNIFAILGCLRFGGAVDHCSVWLGTQETTPLTDDGRSRAVNYAIRLSAIRGTDVRMAGSRNDAYTVTNGCFVNFNPDKDTVEGIWPAVTNRTYIVARISPLTGKETYGIIQAKLEITRGRLQGCIVTVKPGALFGGPEAMFGFPHYNTDPIQAIYLVPEDLGVSLGDLPFQLVSFEFK